MSGQEFVSHYRLGRSDAVLIVAEMLRLDIEQCGSRADFSHPKAYPPPLVSKLPSPEYLQKIRNDILEVARSYGFPVRRKDKDSSLSKFDVEVGNYLVKSRCMAPADAGMEETWNFLTLVVLPDVAAWRFKNKGENTEYERWIGRPRNVFRKAWWRAYCLGPELNSVLGEDEGVGIMERPTFGMNPQLAQTIARAHQELSLDYTMGRSDLLRLVMVQLGKLSSIINLDALPEDATTKLIRDTYLATAKRFESTLQ